MATSRDWEPKRPPLKVFLSAAAATLALSYPFYAVVSALRHVGSGDSLTPCNLEPCHFQRLFSAGAIPQTFGDHVRVQNGNTSRPVLMNSRLESATVARHGLPLAREYMIGLGFVAGGFLYQIPKEHNSSEFEYAHIFCLLGLCVDNKHWIPYLSRLSAISKGLNSEILDKYGQAVHRESISLDEYLQVNSGTRDVISAVDEVASAIKMFQIYSWKFFKGPCVLFQMIFTGFHPSGVEFFPSSLKNNSHPQVDWDRCAQPIVAESITNPLADSKSAMIYLVAIMSWTCVKILHDWMVLFDYNEVVSLHVGILSLYMEAIAIGAGFQAAMGATQAFVALDVDGTSDVCFFRMNRIGVTALIATPCVLFANHMHKKQDVFMAIFCGDMLHYRKESVPYQWLRHHTHDSWHVFSGMVADPLLEHKPSTLGSTSGRARAKTSAGLQHPVAQVRRHATTTRNLLIFWANLKLFWVAEFVFAIIPMALAAGSIFPFILGFMVHKAPVEAVQVHTLGPHSYDAFFTGAYHVFVALTLCGPALFGVYLAWPSIEELGTFVKKHCSSSATQSDNTEAATQSDRVEEVGDTEAATQSHGEEEAGEGDTAAATQSEVGELGDSLSLADDCECLCKSAGQAGCLRTFLELSGSALLVLFWLMNVSLLLPPVEVLAGKSQNELLPYYEFWSVGGFWLTLSAFQGFLTSPVQEMLSLWLSLHLYQESDDKDDLTQGESEDATTKRRTATEDFCVRNDELKSWWLMRLYLQGGRPGPGKFVRSARASPDLVRMFGLDPLVEWATTCMPPPTALRGTRIEFNERWKKLLATQIVDKEGEFVVPWEHLIEMEKKKYDSNKKQRRLGMGFKVGVKMLQTLQGARSRLKNITSKVQPGTEAGNSTPLLPTA